MSDPTAVSRRLVAVFAADVEGYSRLSAMSLLGHQTDIAGRRALVCSTPGSRHCGRDLACQPWANNRKTPQGRRVRFRVALAFALRSDVPSIFIAEVTEAKHAQQDLRDGQSRPTEGDERAGVRQGPYQWGAALEHNSADLGL
jgi:class 3 adenylate cyclase